MKIKDFEINNKRIYTDDDEVICECGKVMYVSHTEELEDEKYNIETMACEICDGDYGHHKINRKKYEQG